MQSKCSEYRFNMAQAPGEASINPKNWGKKYSLHLVSLLLYHHEESPLWPTPVNIYTLKLHTDHNQTVIMFLCKSQQ